MRGASETRARAELLAVSFAMMEPGWIQGEGLGTHPRSCATQNRNEIQCMRDTIDPFTRNSNFVFTEFSKARPQKDPVTLRAVGLPILYSLEPGHFNSEALTVPVLMVMRPVSYCPTTSWFYLWNLRDVSTLHHLGGSSAS